jgi:hypothetical protein
MFARVGEISEMQCFRLLKVDTLYNDPEFVKKKNTEEVILIKDIKIFFSISRKDAKPLKMNSLRALRENSNKIVHNYLTFFCLHLFYHNTTLERGTVKIKYVL